MSDFGNKDWWVKKTNYFMAILTLLSQSRDLQLRSALRLGVIQVTWII